VQPGFSIETHTLDVKEIQRQLETQVLGFGDRLLYFPVTTSTNSLAMQLAHERSAEGVVILTDSQTAGKGRQGRRWVDTPGCNVLSSTLLRPHFPPHFLVMVASLAVVDTIAQTSELAATIKWPNDVLIGERKVAGILIETSHNSLGQLVAILGIGVNVNGTISSIPASTFMSTSSASTASTQEQVPLRAAATTLAMECGRNLSRETFIAHLLAYIENSYLALQQEVDNPAAGVYASLSAFRSIWQRWRNHLSTLGRTVVVRQGNTDLSGIAEDVNDHGELLLRRHSGELITITWGDVGYPQK
jgi:BirA family transcriptional regulator, biotin operon repressor / biotin---[acetyl-CoA-carboxylase] ligase